MACSKFLGWSPFNCMTTTKISVSLTWGPYSPYLPDWGAIFTVSPRQPWVRTTGQPANSFKLHWRCPYCPLLPFNPTKTDPLHKESQPKASLLNLEQSTGLSWLPHIFCYQFSLPSLLCRSYPAPMNETSPQLTDQGLVLTANMASILNPLSSPGDGRPSICFIYQSQDSKLRAGALKVVINHQRVSSASNDEYQATKILSVGTRFSWNVKFVWVTCNNKYW